MAIPAAYLKNTQPANQKASTLGGSRKQGYTLIALIVLGLIVVAGYRVRHIMQHVGQGAVLSTLKDIMPFKISFGGAEVKASEAPQPEKVEGAAPPQKEKTTEDFDPLSIGSENEIKILKSLAERRTQLLKLEDEQRQKELLLQALDKELKQRMVAVEKIKGDVEKTLHKIDGYDKEKLQSLVKIYEGMKAKEAAKILNKLDMKTLRDIVQLMGKRKASEILGAMDENRVKELTMVMINQKNPLAVPAQAANPTK
jgi:flagellar motility protein MotE (MotC chaperone)